MTKINETFDSELSEDENVVYQLPAGNGNSLDENTPFLQSKDPVVYTQTTSGFLYFLVFFSAIGGFLFGYDTGVISGAMIPIKRQFHLSAEYQETIVSITLVGAIVGASTSGYFNDRFGRRIVLFMASFSFTVGSLVMGVGVDISMIIIGRLIVGLGIGYASMTVPIYIAEAAPANIRGQLVTMNQLMITLGIFMASLFNSLFSYMETNGWRNEALSYFKMTK